MSKKRGRIKVELRQVEAEPEPFEPPAGRDYESMFLTGLAITVVVIGFIIVLIGFLVKPNYRP